MASRSAPTSAEEATIEATARNKGVRRIGGRVTRSGRGE
jgi:hypothetical protein